MAGPKLIGKTGRKKWPEMEKIGRKKWPEKMANVQTFRSPSPTRSDKVRQGSIRFDKVRQGPIRSDKVRQGSTRSGKIRHGSAKGPKGPPLTTRTGAGALRRRRCGAFVKLYSLCSQSTGPGPGKYFGEFGRANILGNLARKIFWDFFKLFFVF